MEGFRGHNAYGLLFTDQVNFTAAEWGLTPFPAGQPVLFFAYDKNNTIPPPGYTNRNYTNLLAVNSTDVVLVDGAGVLLAGEKPLEYVVFMVLSLVIILGLGPFYWYWIKEVRHPTDGRLRYGDGDENGGGGAGQRRKGPWAPPDMHHGGGISEAEFFRQLDQYYRNVPNSNEEASLGSHYLTEEEAVAAARVRAMSNKNGGSSTVQPVRASEVREAARLMREMYTLDLELWTMLGAQNVTQAQRAEVMMRADAILAEVRNIVGRWRIAASYPGSVSLPGTVGQDDGQLSDEEKAVIDQVAETLDRLPLRRYDGLY